MMHPDGKGQNRDDRNGIYHGAIAEQPFSGESGGDLRKDPESRQPPCKTCPRCFVVPGLPVAALRPDRLLDTSATLSHRLRRPALDVATSANLKNHDARLIGSALLLRVFCGFSSRPLRLRCSCCRLKRLVRQSAPLPPGHKLAFIETAVV